MKGIFAVLLVALALIGCDKDSSNESYTGVPTDGRSCKEAYKLEANVVKCTNAESRH